MTAIDSPPPFPSLGVRRKGPLGAPQPGTAKGAKGVWGRRREGGLLGKAPAPDLASRLPGPHPTAANTSVGHTTREVTPSPPPLISQSEAGSDWTSRTVLRTRFQDQEDVPAHTRKGNKGPLECLGGVGLLRRSTIQFPIPWGVIQGCRAPDGPPPCGGAPGPGGPEPTAVPCPTKPATGDSSDPIAIVVIIYSF